jgi:hypothetical protein
VAMVVEQTRQRYAALGPDADPALGARFERQSGAATNVAGIMHWLGNPAKPGIAARPRGKPEAAR